MKKTLFTVLTLLSVNSAFGATGDGCINYLKTQLTAKLQNANINHESANLKNEIRAILWPEMEKIIEHNSECSSVKKDLVSLSGTEFSVNVPNHRYDITLNFTETLVGSVEPISVSSDEMESILPWYGILVVQKGSLDNYANSAIPVISTEYMKQHKDKFFPTNSNKTMGMARACTHGNHMAHDKDVINRATHITMNEKDSFWTGNDFYVYDGEDVYWGWATIAGEAALALVTLGLSAEVQASAAAANIAVQTASKSVAAAKLAKNSAKLKKAITVAKAAKSGKTAAATKSRADAVAALSEAGITVKKGTRATELIKIGTALENAVSKANTVWRTSLGHPWKLVKPGIQTLKPKNIAKMYGPGVTWGQRIKRGAITAAGTGIGIEILKAFGYSSASYKLSDNVKFNSFGLLSADDLEGRENEVSHGAWLQFDETIVVNEDDALNEALRFAEEFADDVKTINDKDPLCKGLDIYVVQPAISNPKKMGKREVYYIIQNPAGSVRID